MSDREEEGKRGSQGNPGRGGRMSKGHEARKSTLCAGPTRNPLFLEASEELKVCQMKEFKAENL